MIKTDQETGEQELTQYNNNGNILCPTTDRTVIIESTSTEFDLETGEIDLERRKITKPKFSIPKELLRQSKDGYSKPKCCMLDATEENFTLSKKEQVITLHEVFFLCLFYVYYYVYVKII